MSKFTHFLGGPTGPKICGRRAETNFKDLACCDHFVFNKTLTWLLGPWVWPHSPTGASGWCSRTRWSRPTPWTDARHKVPSSLFLLNIFARVQRLSTWIDKELNDGGELARTLESVKDTLNGTTVPNPSKTFNSVTAR